MAAKKSILTGRAPARLRTEGGRIAGSSTGRGSDRPKHGPGKKPKGTSEMRTSTARSGTRRTEAALTRARRELTSEEKTPGHTKPSTRRALQERVSGRAQQKAKVVNKPR